MYSTKRLVSICLSNACDVGCCAIASYSRGLDSGSTLTSEMTVDLLFFSMI
jgi:hypothetical protein